MACGAIAGEQLGDLGPTMALILEDVGGADLLLGGLPDDAKGAIVVDGRPERHLPDVEGDRLQKDRGQGGRCLTVSRTDG